MQYMVIVVSAVAILAFTGSFVFVCWWSACRRETDLHADSKANCPGIIIIIIFIRSRGTVAITHQQANKINTDTNTKWCSDRKSAIMKKKACAY